MTEKIYLIIKECFSGRFVSIVVFIVTAAAAFSIGSFVIIVQSVENSVIRKFESAIPPGEIKVSRNTKELNGKSLAWLSGIKGVKAVYPLSASQIPMQAVISIFGLNYRTDLVCIGAPAEFVRADIEGAENRSDWLNWKPGMELPVLIPGILIEAYNNSMAEPNGLPEIKPDMAVGRELRIIFGKSSVKEIDGYSPELSRVAGFTDKIKSICLVIPLQAVKFYNNKFKDKTAGDSYISAYVLVESHKMLLGVAEKIEKAGLTAQTDKTLSEEMLSFKRKLESVFFLMTFIVFILALFSVIFSTMIAALHRMDYYRLLRVLGASRIFITISLLFKYSLIGFAGSFAGFIIMRSLLGIFISSLKIQGFEILMGNAGSADVWKAAGAGGLISFLAALPALFMVHSGKMNLDQ